MPNAKISPAPSRSRSHSSTRTDKSLSDLKRNSSPELIQKSKSRIYIFKILMTVALVGAGVAMSTYGFLHSYNLENRVFQAQYHGIIEQLQNVAIQSLKNRIAATEYLSTVAAIFCPLASDWPYCKFTASFFHDFTKPLTDLTSSQNLGFSPLILPEQISDFEDFAYDFYANDPDVQPHTGYGPTTGRGIWSVSKNGKFYRDTTGVVTGSPYNYLAPKFESTRMIGVEPTLMLNVHSLYDFQRMLDNIYECSLAGGQKCKSGISEFTTLSVGNYSADPSGKSYSAIFTPIYPNKDDSKLVGFSGLLFSWESIFDSNTIPSFVDFAIVISTPSAEISFEIHNGNSSYVGRGNHHNKQFSHLGMSYDLTSEFDLGVQYKITYYPTRKFFKSYHTNLPTIVCVGVIVIIIFTSATFLIYDQAVKKEALEKQMVLDAKRVFVRFISHEIRIPMNTVCLGLKLMEDELNLIVAMNEIQNDPTCLSVMKNYTTLIQEVRESSDTAIIVLNDLINYDKIELKSLTIEKVPISIWSIIHKTIKPMLVQAKEKGLELVVHTDLEERKFDKEHLLALNVVGDAVKLGQVIRNIVSNALKFSPRGGQIIVTATYQPDGLPDVICSTPEYIRAGSVTVTCKDFGPGLSPENLKNMFQEGRQFKANELQGGQGSGYGLWISKGIVLQHHGTIDVFSEGEGKGCIFTVVLPVVEQKEKNSEFFAMSNSLASELMGKNYNEMSGAEKRKHFSQVTKIMVVDDAPPNRKILSRMLRNEGFTCVEAENGQQCVELMKNNDPTDPYDLILMDYEMPVMNGPDATRAIRSMGFKTVVLGVTGNVLPSDVKYFMEHGANSVLHKPLTMAMLYDAFSRIYDSRVTSFAD